MSDKIEFRPSQVLLAGLPLCNTMGKAEIEFAAALIVRACQALGDVWQPVTLEEVARVIKQDVDQAREPFTSLMRNPFFKPEFWLLVERGFAKWLGEPGESALELTEGGRHALRRWVS